MLQSGSEIIVGRCTPEVRSQCAAVFHHLHTIDVVATKVTIVLIEVHREVFTFNNQVIADLAKGEINIFNEYFFRDLSAYYMEWQLLANGEVVQTGIVSDLKVAPQQTVKVQIPFDVKNICPCKELLLNVSYKLKAAETLLPAGTTIAYDQLSIRDYKAPELKLENQQASNIPVIVPSILDNGRSTPPH